MVESACPGTGGKIVVSLPPMAYSQTGFSISGSVAHTSLKGLSHTGNKTVSRENLLIRKLLPKTLLMQTTASTTNCLSNSVFSTDLSFLLNVSDQVVPVVPQDHPTNSSSHPMSAVLPHVAPTWLLPLATLGPVSIAVPVTSESTHTETANSTSCFPVKPITSS